MAVLHLTRRSIPGMPIRSMAHSITKITNLYFPLFSFFNRAPIMGKLFVEVLASSWQNSPFWLTCWWKMCVDVEMLRYLSESLRVDVCVCPVKSEDGKTWNWQRTGLLQKGTHFPVPTPTTRNSGVYLFMRVSLKYTFESFHGSRNRICRRSSLGVVLSS